MGRIFLQYLEGDNVYSCKKCRIHLTSYSELISKVPLYFIKTKLLNLILTGIQRENWKSLFVQPRVHII